MAAASYDSHEPRDASPWAFIAGISLGAFWFAGVAAFLIGYYGASLSEIAPEHLVGIVFIAIAPAVVFAMAGWGLRETMRFATTARLLEYSARRLAAPVAHVKADARSVADSIAEQVERLNRDSEGALARLAAMEEVLRHHAETVAQASTQARSQVDSLIGDLQRERTALGDLSDHLKLEADKISETIERQTEIVSTATNVAANQAEEGRATLERSATQMTDAAGAAQKAAEKAAISIDEQLRDMQALVTALEERGTRLEDIARIHSENVKIVQQTAHELNLASDAGADSMKSASDAAIEQARRVSEVIEKETERAVAAGMEEIERMRRAAQSARETAEAAGLALEANADTVIERVRAANEAMMNERPAAPPPPRESREPRESRDQREPRESRNRRRKRRRAEERGRTEERERNEDWLEAIAEHESEPIDLDDDAPSRRLREGRRRSERFAGGTSTREFDDDEREDRRATRNGRHDRAPRPEPPRLIDDLDDGPARRRGNDARASDPIDDDEDEDGEWRWRDLLQNIDDGPAAGMLAGEAVVSGLKRAGIDPSRALDPDMTARVARARRRAGTGEARAIVLDSALGDVRRTSAALAADSTLRGRAEEFVGEHGRLVRRAIDDNDAGLLSSLLDSDTGRAYLLLDAALADG